MVEGCPNPCNPGRYGNALGKTNLLELFRSGRAASAVRSRFSYRAASTSGDEARSGRAGWVAAPNNTPLGVDLREASGCAP